MWNTREKFDYTKDGDAAKNNLLPPAFLTDIGTGHTSTIISTKVFTDTGNVQNFTAWNQGASTQV